MARPSQGSRYFQEIASQAQSRRASMNHELLVNRNRSQSQPPREPDQKPKIDKEEVERMKQKYTVQNKSLAQQNSALSLKLSDMESKISDLINENMTLRKRKSLQDKDIKALLEKKLKTIESNFICKFDDLLLVFKDIRAKEGLSENPQLDILNEFTRPTTSTPMNDSHNDLDFGNPIDVDAHKATLFLPSLHNELSKLSQEKPQAPKQSRPRRSFGESPDLALFRIPPTVVETGESGTDNSVETTNEKVDDAMIALDDSETPNELPTRELSEVLNENMSDNTNGGFKVFRDDTQENRRNNTKNTSKSIPQKQSLLSNSPAPEADIKIEDEQTGRRSTRTRRNINYAEPRRGLKIRRESAKMMDAVGGYLPLFKEREESVAPGGPEPTTSSKKRRKVSGKDQDLALKNQQTGSQSEKRMPLSNVTNSSNKVEKKPKSSIGDKATDVVDMDKVITGESNQVVTESQKDLSIFDLNERDQDRPKRFYRRRSTMIK